MGWGISLRHSQNLPEFVSLVEVGWHLTVTKYSWEADLRLYRHEELSHVQIRTHLTYAGHLVDISQITGYFNGVTEEYLACLLWKTLSLAISGVCIKS